MTTAVAPYYMDPVRAETYKAAMGWPVDSVYDPNTGKFTLGTGPAAVPKSALGSQALIPSQVVNGTQFYNDPNFGSYLQSQAGLTGNQSSLNAKPGMSQEEWNAYKAMYGLPADSTYDSATGMVIVGQLSALKKVPTGSLAPTSQTFATYGTQPVTGANGVGTTPFGAGRSQDEWNAYKVRMGLPIDSTYDSSTGQITRGTGVASTAGNFGGGTGAGTGTNYSSGLTGGTGNNVTPGMYDVNPELAYRQALGFGDKTALNPYERWQRDQFGDVQSAWQVQQEMNPSGTPTTFQDYLAQNGIKGAQDFWKGSSSSILGDNEMNNKLATMMSESDYNSVLSNAIRNKYGPGSMYGSYLARQIPEASSFYNAQFATSPTTTPNTFLSYLKGKYGF